MSHPALPVLSPASIDGLPEAKKLQGSRSRRGWSYYGTWSECQRKWAFANLYPPPVLAPNSARGASLGTLVHALLERHYKVEMGILQPTVDEVMADNSEGVDAEGQTLAMDRYREYVARTVGDDWTPMYVEEELSVGFLLHPDGSVETVAPETPRSVLYTSRLDLVVVDGQGRVWIVDHKTAARLSRGSGSDYGMSGQVHGFFHLGRAYFGHRFAGVTLNFIQTLAGPKFERKPPPAAPFMVQQHPWTVVAIASEIRQWHERVLARAHKERRPPTALDFRPASSASICVSKWGPCPYKDTCRMGL